MSDLQNDSGFGTYTKPNGGIPKTDLTSDVQTSLGKADTALQTAPVEDVQINGTSIVANGEANIPIANSSTPGVMTVGGSTFGVALTGNQLRLSVAGNSAVKAGVASANPITPAT